MGVTVPLIEIGPYLLPNVAAAGPGRQLDRVKTIVRSMTAPEGTFSYDFARQLSGVEAPEAVRVDMLQDTPSQRLHFEAVVDAFIEQSIEGSYGALQAAEPALHEALTTMTIPRLLEIVRGVGFPHVQFDAFDVVPTARNAPPSPPPLAPSPMPHAPAPLGRIEAPELGWIIIGLGAVSLCIFVVCLLGFDRGLREWVCAQLVCTRDLVRATLRARARRRAERKAAAAERKRTLTELRRLGKDSYGNPIQLSAMTLSPVLSSVVVESPPLLPSVPSGRSSPTTVTEARSALPSDRPPPPRLADLAALEPPPQEVAEVAAKRAKPQRSRRRPEGRAAAEARLEGWFRHHFGSARDTPAVPAKVALRDVRHKSMLDRAAGCGATRATPVRCSTAQKLDRPRSPDDDWLAEEKPRALKASPGRLMVARRAVPALPARQRREAAPPQRAATAAAQMASWEMEQVADRLEERLRLTRWLLAAMGEAEAQAAGALLEGLQVASVDELQARWADVQDSLAAESRLVLGDRLRLCAWLRAAGVAKDASDAALAVLSSAGIASPAQLEALWRREDGVARQQVRLRSRALADLVDAGLLAAESAETLMEEEQQEVPPEQPAEAIALETAEASLQAEESPVMVEASVQAEEEDLEAVETPAVELLSAPSPPLIYVDASMQTSDREAVQEAVLLPTEPSPTAKIEEKTAVVEVADVEVEAVDEPATAEEPVASPVLESRPPPSHPPEIVRLLQAVAQRSSVEAIERAVECAREAGSASDAVLFELSGPVLQQMRGEAAAESELHAALAAVGDVEALKTAVANAAAFRLNTPLVRDAAAQLARLEAARQERRRRALEDAACTRMQAVARGMAARRLVARMRQAAFEARVAAEEALLAALLARSEDDLRGAVASAARLGVSAAVVSAAEEALGRLEREGEVRRAAEDSLRDALAQDEASALLTSVARAEDVGADATLITAGRDALLRLEQLEKAKREAASTLEKALREGRTALDDADNDCEKASLALSTSLQRARELSLDMPATMLEADEVMRKLRVREAEAAEAVAVAREAEEAERLAEVRKRVEAAERRAAEEAAVEEARLERIRLKREARLEEEQATREAQLQREASIRGDLQAAYRKKGLGAAGGSGTSLLAQIRQRNAAAIAWTPSAAEKATPSSSARPPPPPPLASPPAADAPKEREIVRL